MIPHPPPSYAHLLDALLAAAARLEFPGENAASLTSTKRAFETALALLAQRERGGTVAAQARLTEVHELLSGRQWFGVPPDTARIDQALKESGKGIAQAESATAQLLYLSENALASADAVLNPTQLKALCEWEFNDLTRDAAAANASASEADTSIDAARLQAYLRERCSDAALIVDECRQLMGGFGKDTYLFSARGKALNGEFVIRRDHPLELIPGACHRVHREYEVIKAVRSEGFPAPDALWVERDHPLLPGGDFMVMRRSPGVAGGTLQGAGSKPNPALNDQLGTLMGRLHSLRPLTRLGSLTESIRPELWATSSAEVLRAYLREFRAMLLDNAHAPSVATVAVFNWLIANVPDTPTPPCLIHGDIGFHNMLLQDGEIVALLDWESAQIGHPGQDLAYVYNAGHADLDWPRVMRAYQAAGGTPLSEQALLYFRIMMLGRLLVTLNIGPSRLFTGDVKSVRLLAAETVFRPPVLKQMAALIDSYTTQFGAGATA